MSKLTLTFKGNALREIALIQGEMTIGSAPSCDIFIDSLAINPKHATITTTGNESVIRDCGTSDGTFINNKQVQEHLLVDSDDIRIGKHNLRFTQQAFTIDTEPELQKAGAQEEPVIKPNFQAKRKRAWLQLLSGNNLGKAVHIKKNFTNLGTPGVQTAALVLRDEGYFLSHLEGDKTPTVNDEPIGNKTFPLKDGDIINIGNVKMQFSMY